MASPLTTQQLRELIETRGFTARAIDNVHMRIKEALKEVADDLGFDIKLNPTEYSRNEFTAAAQASILTEDGVNLAEEREFKKHSAKYGVAPSWFQREFYVTNHLCRIIGINLSNRKFKFRYINLADNVIYKCETKSLIKNFQSDKSMLHRFGIPSQLSKAVLQRPEIISAIRNQVIQTVDEVEELLSTASGGHRSASQRI